MRNYICVYGTFEGLHEGHRALIKTSIEYAIGMNKKLVILVSSNEYAQSKRRGTSSYIERCYMISEFIKADKDWKYYVDYSFAEYLDPFPNGKAFGVVTSKDTIQESINYRDIFDPKLLILIAPTVYGEDGKPISSTKIIGDEIVQPEKPLLNGTYKIKDV